MAEEQKKLFKVITPRVAKYLQSLGFRVVDIQPDLYNPKYNTFFFYDTPALQLAMKNLPPRQQ